MNKENKVLIVHNYYQIPGGEDTVVANEKRMLEEHGYEVILYSRDNSELNTLSIVNKFLLPFTTIFNLRTYFEVRKIIKERDIEIVHVHNTLSLVSNSVYYAARSCKVPVVQTMHNFRLLCPGATFYRDGHICEDCVEKGLVCAVKHSCYRNSKLQTLACVISMKFHRMTGIYGKINYICLTEFNKVKLLTLKQIKPERVFVKPNFTYECKIKKETRDFYLYIGRLEEIKGVTLLIEAFSRIPEQKLKLVGTGIKVEYYREIIKKKNASNIELMGFVDQKTIAHLLSRTKAVVVTSQCYETFGMMIIEAFASHTPVIVGNIGNTGSLVDDGINGIKYIYDSVDSLVNAVIRFETMNHVQLENNAYMKFRDLFNADVNYKLMNTIYENMLL